jgi:hypothetical protein
MNLMSWLKKTISKKAEPQRVALINPMSITKMWSGPDGKPYVEAEGMLFERYKPLPPPHDAPDGFYRPYTWIPIEALPDGCELISAGPVARPLTDEEVRALTPEQRAQLGL